MIPVLLMSSAWSAPFKTSSPARTQSFKIPAKAATPAFKTTPGQNFKFGAGGNSINDQFNKKQSKKSFNGFQALFPNQQHQPKSFPKEDLEKYRNQYRSNPLYEQSARQADPWTARNHYYQANSSRWSSGISDTGLISAVFLYSLLNNTSNAAQYAHNHQYDPDYRQWREEADQMAKNDPELKQALAKVDSQKQGITTQPNPNWLPAGVPASAALSAAALTASLPTLNICTGSESGPYYAVAKDVIYPEVGPIVNMALITTKGSPDILAKLQSGACDAGFLQGDTLYDAEKLEVVFKPFLEAGHLACSVDSNSKTISDIADKKIWIPKNSGSRMTWDRLATLNPAYKDIAVQDAENYEDAILKATQNQGCLFYMAAPHAAAIDRLINRKDLRLVAIDDPLLLKGDVYQSRTLSSEDYGRAIEDSAFSYAYVQTIVAPALFVVSKQWTEKFPEKAATFKLQLNDLQRKIKREVKQ